MFVKKNLSLGGEPDQSLGRGCRPGIFPGVDGEWTGPCKVLVKLPSANPPQAHFSLTLFLPYQETWLIFAGCGGLSYFLPTDLGGRS